MTDASTESLPPIVRIREVPFAFVKKNTSAKTRKIEKALPSLFGFHDERIVCPFWVSCEAFSWEGIRWQEFLPRPSRSHGVPFSHL